MMASDKDAPDQPYRVRLLAVILIAFGLTTFRLASQSLWYDEGVTALVAQRGVVALTEWTAGDIQPPLYYYVVAAWGTLAGWGEWALRFPSAWFVTVSAPLMAVLALRLSRSHSAGVLAALFVAFHPLLVYYGQEARMYAQLTMLGLLSAYLLVRLADTPAPRLVGWMAFVVVGTAALYTHYFALFLLIGLAIAFLLDARWQRTSFWRKSFPLFAAGAAILLLYIPWLGAMFGQLREDRSYWTGTLKLDEALAKVAISFTSGETVFESTALWLLAGYGGVTLLSVVVLWRHDVIGRRVLLYAGCWLVAPVAAVLSLALVIPKFNARYVMEALPALLLIWASGLALSSDQRSKHRRTPLASLVASMLVIGFFLGVSNWFFNPSFDKDHWRQLAAFLRPRLAPEETVVLVSGHAWPVWEYYAADLPVVRLPDLEILDVDAVLDFATTGAILRKVYAEGSGLNGAWLVTWQDEVVDPNGVTPVQMELSGREKGQSATFSGLGLRRFTGFRPHRFVDAPPIDTATDIVFGNQVILRGYKVVDNGDLLLFWERLPGITGSVPDLHFALTAATAEGAPVAAPPERRLAGYTYPFARWQSGAIVASHLPARDWLGSAETAPGAYRFSLRVFDALDPTAAPLPTSDGRTIVEFGPIDVEID